MIDAILDGLLLGLTLTILIGPIFIALTQTGIQKGIRAGVSVGTGIWTSDVIIIILTYYFVRQIETITAHPDFTYYLGLVGGLILLGFGVMSLIKKVDWSSDIKPFSAKTFAGYWTKGFLVNTINPFTFIFWLGTMTTYVSQKKISPSETLVLFSVIMLTIMITDSLKVILAKLIRNKLQSHHLDMITKGTGIILFIFGIVLFYKSGVIGGS
jgi:threonine/homoserine/homoserine lactone efflux protein